MINGREWRGTARGEFEIPVTKRRARKATAGLLSGVESDENANDDVGDCDRVVVEGKSAAAL